MKKQQFTHEQNKVLSEIYRRLNYFHGGNLNENLLYLAYPSEAKKIAAFQLITPYSHEIPRVLNWYRLTKKGRAFFSHYVTKQKLSPETNSKLFGGEMVKEFNATYLNDLTGKDIN